MKSGATVGQAIGPFQLDVEDAPPGALRVMSFSGHEAMNAIGVFDVLIAAPELDDRAVLAPHGIERHWDLSRALPKRPYCVQYHESDLAFVRSLLAEDGIFFRFDHPIVDGARATSRDVLVLFDAAEKVPAMQGGERRRAAAAT